MLGDTRGPRRRVVGDVHHAPPRGRAREARRSAPSCRPYRNRAGLDTVLAQQSGVRRRILLASPPRWRRSTPPARSSLILRSWCRRSPLVIRSKLVGLGSARTTTSTAPSGISSHRARPRLAKPRSTTSEDGSAPAASGRRSPTGQFHHRQRVRLHAIAEESGRCAARSSRARSATRHRSTPWRRGRSQVDEVGDGLPRTRPPMPQRVVGVETDHLDPHAPDRLRTAAHVAISDGSRSGSCRR